ncbi:MAG: hypothetical protein Q8M01_05080 [Rubrivivax sp.]|nr:hypothetical protein [Rubrivivax sp.]
MAIPDQSRVQELLSPHNDAVVGIAQSAWARWERNPERAQLYRRVRACLVHNYMMLDAIPNLPADERIKHVEGQETALFLISDELVIRFKKGNEKGLTSNIGTQAVLEYNDPEESLSLLGLPDLIRVDIAYVLNDLQTKIQDVLVVARDNERVAWSYSIMQRAADVGDPTYLPIDPQQPPPADTGLRLPEINEEKKRIDGAQ